LYLFVRFFFITKQPSTTFYKTDLKLLYTAPAAAKQTQRFVQLL